MNDLTMRCTQAQTMMALLLGAPIERQGYTTIKDNELPDDWFSAGSECYHIPTCEQMINWIESKWSVRFHVCSDQLGESYEYFVRKLPFQPTKDAYFSDFEFATRIEATLAAIDATLEYLFNSIFGCKYDPNKIIERQEQLFYRK